MCWSCFKIIKTDFSLRYVKDGQHLHMLGQKMEDLIFTVADTNFFFNDLEDCDQVTISSNLSSLFWWVTDRLFSFLISEN